MANCIVCSQDLRGEVGPVHSMTPCRSVEELANEIAGDPTRCHPLLRGSWSDGLALPMLREALRDVNTFGFSGDDWLIWLGRLRDRVVTLRGGSRSLGGRETWNDSKLLEIAKESGKPLEVECATAFLDRNNPRREGPKWEVELSSYFTDPTTDKLRELDVLASEKDTLQLKGQPFERGLYVACSCKGFKPNVVAATYSVSDLKATTSHDPSVLFSRSPQYDLDVRRSEEIGEQAMLRLGLTKIPRIVGFQVLSEAGSGPTFRYSAQGDSELFTSGMDSAVKASMFWLEHLKVERKPSSALFIPLLVLSRPWADFQIDDGRVAGPVQRDLGYMTTYTPVQINNPAISLISLVCSMRYLGSLIGDIESLSVWYSEKGRKGWVKD